MLDTFRALFNQEARLYRAPGRVNLIGEHTDYNDGWVLPAAIDLYTDVAASVRADRQIVAHSKAEDETVSFDLDEVALQPAGHWSDYLRGVAVMLERSGHRLCGANLLVGGDLPIGAGLSSSAAFEVATALALTDVANLALDKRSLALTCWQAESEFVGLRCGVMDQFITCLGRAHHALLLDCRSLAAQLLPLPETIRLVICNSMVSHQLISGEYNARRQACEEGVALLAQRLPRITALRDVSLADLQRHADLLPDSIYKRCHHVISENARVGAAAAALESGDLATFGHLMAASHQSLRDAYEVSCAELDLLVELANQCAGVYGARMTGGGFGGCTINLIAADHVEEFKRQVPLSYKDATSITPKIYVCEAVGGAERIYP